MNYKMAHLQVNRIERSGTNYEAIYDILLLSLLHKGTKYSIPYYQDASVIFVQAIQIAS